MNKRQVTIILAVMVLAIFSSACTQTGEGTIYRTGTKGVSLVFLDSDTKNVYEGEEFGLGVTVKNEGSADVTESNPGKLKVSYDTYRLKTEDEKALSSDIVLNGKSQYYPVGDEFPVSFYFNASRLTHLREGATTTINFNLCYPYHTEMTTMTCIDTKKANNDQSTSACSSEAYNGASGQGAPIVITRVEPEILLQSRYVRPQFKIFIENRGEGYVTLAEKCSDTTFTDKEIASKVKVKAWLSGKTELECGPDKTGIVRLSDSESFITCYLPQKNDNDYNITAKNYITTLTVNLSYTYIYIGKYDVEIKRNDNLEPETTTSKCLSYEIEDPETGKCTDMCSYYAKYPGKTSGYEENKPTADFMFDNTFSCSCELSECNEREGNGNCIKGYCPGNLYCCAPTTGCDQYQIRYNGECINKCEYCANTHHEADTAICGSFNFTDFSCRTMTSTECDTYAKDKACIKGYCGGTQKGAYCANLDKVTATNTTTG